MYSLTLKEFKIKCKKGNLIPIYREILADLETPVSAFLKIDRGDYSFLLESIEGGEKWARYSFLGSNPSLVFKFQGNRVEIIREGNKEKRSTSEDPLAELKKILSVYRPVETEGLPRFYGGAVGFLTYDVVRFFEKLPCRDKKDLQIPESVFMVTDTLLIFDNLKKNIKVVANAFLDGKPPEAVYKAAIIKIEEIIGRLKKGLAAPKSGPQISVSKVKSNFSRAKYMAAVDKTKEYIRAGDIFQVALAQRIEKKIEVDPFDIYRALRVINPSPYMYFLKFGDIRLVGSSPEVMVRLEGDQVELRPIAGTRPRGKSVEEDQRLIDELKADPKEKAEHIMLVDLGRNDLGRISENGQVRVEDLMVTEKYSHVIHLVSNIKGRLQKGKDCFDVIRATFPAGTVSGAPKIRAMEIIEELEPTRRGIYAGAVGYFSFSGNMDTAIAIRTLLIKDQTAYLGVGAGIVADSDPATEYQETLNKGRALLKAIEMAEKGL